MSMPAGHVRAEYIENLGERKMGKNIREVKFTNFSVGPYKISLHVDRTDSYESLSPIHDLLTEVTVAFFNYSENAKCKGYFDTGDYASDVALELHQITDAIEETIECPGDCDKCKFVHISYNDRIDREPYQECRKKFRNDAKTKSASLYGKLAREDDQEDRDNG